MSKRTYTRTYLAQVEQEIVVDDDDLSDEQIAILDDPRYTDAERDEVVCDFEADYEDHYAIDDWQLTITRTDKHEEN